MGQRVVLFGALEQQPMIAEMVAMVRGEDLDSPVGNSCLIGSAAHLADRFVHHCNHPTGQRPRFQRLALRDGHRIA